MELAKDSLAKLVERFKSDESRFITSSSSYQETEVRVEFIDPFFELLGWSMNNSAGLPNALRDVLREESQPTETTTKKPDYTFRLQTKRKFFVEAKKPSVDIRTNKDSAFQVRSYGYTDGHHIAVLTNFRTLRIYDVQLEPKANDDADVGLLVSIDYKEFVSKFDYIEDILNREKVATGSIERVFKVSSTGLIPANTSFLKRINSWRIRIAQDLFLRYPHLSINELTDFTQKIINRIIFIRMCEDRGIEGENTLRAVANKKSFVELRTLFKRLDIRYNTGLFDVSIDRLQDKYEIDANVFIDIVNEIYAPNSPYSFSILNADFLGQVYELFLGQQLIILNNQIVSLENKPAYEHREIVTTPQPLVDEIVRRVFQSKNNQFKENHLFNLESIQALQVFDVAVGSGRFLLRAFDEMVESAIEAILENGNTKLLYKVSENNYKLAFTEKRKIISKCLFGCDIDYNAVEIARFSLMVRLLEDETKDTLPNSTEKKILPDLDNNILHGNTVVDIDFQFQSGDVFNKTQPRNFLESGFPNNFDIVLGNPPYVKTEEMLSDNAEEMNYFKMKYESAFKQFDKYFIFIELAISKMKPDSYIGMVVSNKWMTNESGKKLRDILARTKLISQIVNFGNENLFEGKLTYVCLIVLNKNSNNDFYYRHINNYQDYLLSPKDKGFRLSNNLLKSDAWVLPNSKHEAILLDKLINNSIPLSQIINIKNGIQTSANDVFLLDKFNINGNYIEFTKNETQWSIEKSITRAYVNDSSIITSYESINSDALMIFPYEMSINGSPVAIDPKTMLLKYPKAMAYLKANESRLNKRKVSPPPKEGIFYAYGRHQALEVVFSFPKIIYSVNQRGDKYGLDNDGIAYSSGGTAGEVALLNPVGGYSLEFIIGLLNQKAVEFFLRKRGSPFDGGWYSRGSAVISDVPVPFIDILNNNKHKIVHDEIADTVKTIMKTKKAIQSASGRDIQILTNEYQDLIKSLESKFNVLWGIKDEFNNLSISQE